MPDNDKIITPENQGNITPKSGIPLIKQSKQSVLPSIGSMKRVEQIKNPKLSKKEMEEAAAQAALRDKAEEFSNTTSLNDLLQSVRGNNPYYKDTTDSYTLGFNPYTAFDALGDDATFNIDDNFSQRASDQQSGWQQAGYAITGGITSGVMRALRAIASIPNLIPNYEGEGSEGYQKGGIFNPYNWQFDWEQNAVAKTLSNASDSIHEDMPIYTDPDRPLSMDSSMFWSGVQGIIESAIEFGAIALTTKGLGATASGILGAAVDAAQLSKIGIIQRIGVGAARTANAASKLTNVFGKTAGEFISGLPHGFVANQMEGIVMGLDHYKQRVEELIQAGIPEDVAKKYAANEASDLRLQNTWMMATDILQMNAIFGRAGKKGLVGGGFRQWFKDFNPTKVSSWLSVTSPITQGALEGIEEMLQSGIESNITNQSNKELNRIYRAGLKYDEDKGTGLEAILKYSTTNQAILEGLMGVFGAGLQNGVARYGNKIASNIRYNKIQKNIDIAEKELASLTDSKEDKVKAEILNKKIKNYKGELLSTVRGKYLSQQDQIKENNNIVANQMSELYNQMEAYSDAIDKGDDVTSDTIEGNLFSGLMLRNLTAGTDEHFISQLEDYAKGKKEAESLFGVSTEESREKAKELASRAREMQKSWDEFSTQSNATQKFWHQENVLNTSRGIPKMTERISKIEESLNEKIRERDEAAKKVNPNAVEFKDLDTLKTVQYQEEEFKEKGKRLKELTAKDNLSPEEVRERKQLYDKEKKEHENEQDKKREAFEAEKNEFLKDKELVRAKKTLEELKKVKDDSSRALGYLKSVQFDVVDKHLNDFFYKHKFDNTDKDLDELEKLVKTRYAINDDGKEFLLNKIKAYREQVELKRKIDNIIAENEDFKNKAKDRENEIKEKLDNFDENTDLRVTFETPDGVTVKAKVYEIDEDNIFLLTNNPLTPKLFIDRKKFIEWYKNGDIRTLDEDFEIYDSEKEAIKLKLEKKVKDIQEFIDIWKLEEIRIDDKISEHETTLAKLEALLQSNIKVSNDFIAELAEQGLGNYTKWAGWSSIETFDELLDHVKKLKTTDAYNVAKLLTSTNEELESLRDSNPEIINSSLMELKSKLEDELSELEKPIDVPVTPEMEDKIFQEVTEKIEKRIKDIRKKIELQNKKIAKAKKGADLAEFEAGLKALQEKEELANSLDELLKIVDDKIDKKVKQIKSKKELYREGKKEEIRDKILELEIQIEENTLKIDKEALIRVENAQKLKREIENDLDNIQYLHNAILNLKEKLESFSRIKQDVQKRLDYYKGLQEDNTFTEVTDRVISERVNRLSERLSGIDKLINKLTDIIDKAYNFLKDSLESLEKWGIKISSVEKKLRDDLEGKVFDQKETHKQYKRRIKGYKESLDRYIDEYIIFEKDAEKAQKRYNKLQGGANKRREELREEALNLRDNIRYLEDMLYFTYLTEEEERRAAEEELARKATEGNKAEKEESEEFVLSEVNKAILNLLDDIEYKIIDSEEYKKDPGKFERLLQEISNTKELSAHANGETMEQALENIQSLLNSNFKDESESISNIKRDFKSREIPGEPVYDDSVQKVSYKSNPKNPSVFRDGKWVESTDGIQEVHPLELNEGGLTDYNITIDAQNPKLGKVSDKLYGEIIITFSNGVKALVHTSSWHLATENDEFVSQKEYESEGEKKNYYKFHTKSPIYEVLKDTKKSKKEKVREIVKIIKQQGDGVKFINSNKFAKENVDEYYERIASETIDTYNHRQDLINKGIVKSKIINISKGSLRESGMKPSNSVLDTSYELKLGQTDKQKSEKAISPSGIYVKIPVKSNIDGKPRYSEVLLQPRTINDEDYENAANAALEWLKNDNKIKPTAAMMALVKYLPIRTHKENGAIDFDYNKDEKRVIKIGNRRFTEDISGEDKEKFLQLFKEAVEEEVKLSNKNEINIKQIKSELVNDNRNNPDYLIKDGKIQLIPVKDYILENTETFLNPIENNGIKYFHIQPIYEYKINNKEEVVSGEEQTKSVEVLKSLSEEYKKFKPNNDVYESIDGEIKLIRVSKYIGKSFDEGKYPASITAGNYVDAIGRYYFDHTSHNYEDFVKEFKESRNYLEDLESKNNDENKSKYLQFIDNSENSKQIFNRTLELFEEIEGKIREIPGLEDAVIFSKEILLSYYFNEEKENNGILSDGIGGSTDLIAVDSEGNFHIFDIKSTITNTDTLEKKIEKNELNWKAQQDVYSEMLERLTGKDVTTNIIAIGVNYTQEGEIPLGFKVDSNEIFNIERDRGIRTEDLIKSGEGKPLESYPIIKLAGKSVINKSDDPEYDAAIVKEKDGRFYVENKLTKEIKYGKIIDNKWVFDSEDNYIKNETDPGINNNAIVAPKNEEDNNEFLNIPFSIAIDRDIVRDQATSVIASWNGNSIPFDLQTTLVDKVFIVALAKIHGKYYKESAERDEKKLKESILEILKSDINNSKSTSKDLLNIEEYYDVIWNQAKIKLQSTGISLRTIAKKISPDLKEEELEDGETGADKGPAERFGVEIFEIDDFDTVSHIVKTAIALTPKATLNEKGNPVYIRDSQTGYIKFLDVEDTVRALRRILSGIPNLTFFKNDMLDTSIEELLKKEAENSGKKHYLALFEYMKTWDTATRNALVSNFKNVKNNFKTIYWNVKDGKLESNNIDSIRDNGAGILVQQWGSYYLDEANGFVERDTEYNLKLTEKSREIYNKYKEIQAAFYRNKDKDAAIEKLLPLFFEMGINIKKEDLKFIFEKSADYTEIIQGKRIYFNPMNDTSPFGKLFTWMRDVKEGDYISKRNPFKDAENFFKELGIFISSRSDNEYSESFRSKDGSTRFAYTTFDLMTQVATALKNGTFNELYGDLLGAFGKSQRYSIDTAFNFSMITESSEKGNSLAVPVNSMTPLEREATILSLLFNGGSDTRHIISPTNSDKSRIFTISVKNIFSDNHGKHTIDRSIDPLLRGVQAESDRMSTKGGDTGDSRFEEGHKFYYTMPQINYAVAKELITNHLKSIWSDKNLQNGIREFNSKYKKGEKPSADALNNPGIAEYFLMAGKLPNNAENIQVEDLVDLIMDVNYTSFGKSMIVNNDNYFVSFMAARVFNENVEKIKDRWNKLGIATLEGKESKILIDEKWIKNTKINYPVNNGKGSFEEKIEKYHEEVLDTAAREYLYLTKDSNLSFYQTISGDPAISFKKGKGYDGSIPVNEMSAKVVLKTISATYKEVIKRNAKNLASGKLLNFYVWDGTKFYEQKEYTVTVIKDDERNSLIKELHKIKQYNNMNVANAYELTTGIEFLNVEWANNGDGHLSEELYKRIYEKLKYQDSLEWDRDVPEKYLLTDEELLVVNGAQKPVQVSPIKYENNSNLTGRFYGKSAAFPLIHQLIKGTELAKLKKALNRQKIDRALFESAVKNGAIRPTTVWENGKFNEIGKLHPIKLKRSGFYIQNEIPYDPTKKEILLVSQMDKLITDHFATNHPEYKYKKAEIRKAMFNAAKQELMKHLDIGEVTDADGNKIYILNDKRKLIDVLKKEVERRGYSINDISSLEMDSWGNLKIPLFFNPIANKLESVLTSFLSKTIRQKVHGQSYVQASAIGIVTVDEYEDTNKKGGIIRIPTYDKNGNKVKRDATPRFIRSEDGKVEAAEVYVPWKFLKNNEIIEISKYIDEDGDLDVSKIDPKLLQLITARIPNQGHSSMLPVKIIGFLPSNRNTIIVPLEIVGQMGSDFDVDKLYAYMWNYKVFKDGRIVLHDSNEKRRREIRDEINEKYEEENIKLRKERNKSLQEYLKDSDDEYKKLLDKKKKELKINEEIKKFLKPLRNKKDRTEEEEEDYQENLVNLEESEANLKKINNEIFEYIKSKKGQDLTKDLENKNKKINDLYDKITDEINKKYTEEGIEKGNEDLSKLDLKTLQNRYFDLHWEILTHPEMLDIIRKPLDLDDLKEQAQEIEDNKNAFDEEYSITDPLYNTDSYFENKAGKEGVAIESIALTLNAILQNGGQFKLKNGDLPMEFIVSNDFKLTNLGIDSRSTYKGEERSITDNIKNIQNEALDNAKNGNLGVLNFNKNTFNAINALLMLSSEDGKSLSNEYTVALITHPAVLNYIEQREYTFNSYRKNYSRKADNLLRKNLGAYATNQIIVPSIESLKNGSASNKEVLNLFFALDELGQQLSILNKAINASTKGLGKSFIESKLKSLLYEEMIINGDSRSLFYNISIDGLEQLRDTEYGYAVEDVVSFSNAITEHLYPYEKMMNKLYNYFKVQGIEVNEKDWRKIFEEYKSYVFSNDLFYSDDVVSERKRLLRGEDNIFKRFKEIKKDPERGNVGDYLLRSLFVEIFNEEKVLKYPAARTERLDSHYGTLSLLQLLNSPIDKYREFAKDFITYTYLTNANQSPYNFIKFMPYSVLVSLSNKLTKEQNKLENGDINYESFLTQLVQHSPSFAPINYDLRIDDFDHIPLKSEILEKLKKYEDMPDTSLKAHIIKKLYAYLNLYNDSKINLFDVNNDEGSIAPFVRILVKDVEGDHEVIFKIVRSKNGFKGEYLKNKSDSFYKKYVYDADFVKSIPIEQNRDRSFVEEAEEYFGLKNQEVVNGDTAFNKILNDGNDVQREMVKVLDQIKERPKIKMDTESDSPGKYGNNVIYINPLKPGVSFDMDAKEDFIYTLIHERTHHMLYDKIEKGDLTEKEKEILGRIEGLRHQAIALLNEDERKEFLAFCKTYEKLMDKSTKDRVDKMKKSDEKIEPLSSLTSDLKSKYYGLLNNHEFVAMAWSDEGFQKSLNKKSGIIFDKIIDTIVNLLKEIEKRITGIDNDSILAQTLSQSVQLMKEFNNNENPKFKPNTPVIVNKIIEQMHGSTAELYMDNAVAKSFIATQAIASSKSGTTSKVEEAFGNKANTGIYSDSDIVMFSANGNRRKDKTSVVQEENGVITLTDEYENIQKAVNAGAHIVNDSDQHLANTNSKFGNYNTGEIEFEKWMKNNASNYEKTHVTIKVNDNNIKIGYWKPKNSKVKIEDGKVEINYVTPSDVVKTRGDKSKKSTVVNRKVKPAEEVKGINFLRTNDAFVRQLIPMFNNVSFKYEGKKYENLIHAFETWKSGNFNEEVYTLGVGKTSNSSLSLFSFSNEEDTSLSKNILKKLIYERMSQNSELVDGIAERGGLEFLKKSTFKLSSDDTLVNNFLDLTAEAYSKLENGISEKKQKDSKEKSKDTKEKSKATAKTENTKKDKEIKKYYSITEEIVHEDVEELGKDIKNATKKYSVEQSLYTDKLIKDSIGKGNKLTFKKEKRVFSVKGGETRASALLSIAEGDRTRVSVSKSVVESIKERAKLQGIKKGVKGTIIYFQDKDKNSPTYGSGVWVRIISDFFEPKREGFEKEGMIYSGKIGGKNDKEYYDKVWEFYEPLLSESSSFDFEVLKGENFKIAEKDKLDKPEKNAEEAKKFSRELKEKAISNEITQEEIDEVNNILNNLPYSISINNSSEFFLPKSMIKKFSNNSIDTGIRNNGKEVEIYINNASDAIINMILAKYIDKGVIEYTVSNLFDNNYVIRIPLSKLNIDNINNPQDRIENLELDFNFEIC